MLKGGQQLRKGREITWSSQECDEGFGVLWSAGRDATEKSKHRNERKKREKQRCEKKQGGLQEEKRKEGSARLAFFQTTSSNSTAEPWLVEGSQSREQSRKATKNAEQKHKRARKKC